MAINIGTHAGQRHGPNGSFERPQVPYFSALNGLLIVNPRSGRGSLAADDLVGKAQRLGIETHVLEPGDQPAEVARRSSAQVLGVAGGGGAPAAPAPGAPRAGTPLV